MYSGKRLFDISISLVLIVILFPFSIIISLLIKVDSKGPVFYKAIRVGQFGKDFKMWKFRSMIMGSDKKGPSITAIGDDRITLMGKVLRTTKIDELPSLINVIKGDMSLVGPRPENPNWVSRYPINTLEVLNVKPGITGPAQIKYRNEEKLLNSENLDFLYGKIMHDKLNIDLNYIQKQSFLLDLKIIVKTIKILLKK
jgi:lipopolysaccharide/colanic/teichoic acid biosynthesis glycosyltransferase